LPGSPIHFRNIDWAGGSNQRVSRVNSHLEATFPRIVFGEQMVDEIL